MKRLLTEIPIIYSIRRGYQVYREVCSACHSLDRIAWRNLIDVSHSEDEVKAMAEEVEYEDGPDDQGEMFQRPGKVNHQKLVLKTIVYFGCESKCPLSLLY